MDLFVRSPATRSAMAQVMFASGLRLLLVVVTQSPRAASAWNSAGSRNVGRLGIVVRLMVPSMDLRPPPRPLNGLCGEVTW